MNLGGTTQERLDSFRKPDAIGLPEIRGAGPYGAIRQALPMVLPTRTGGVLVDVYTFDQVCGLRAMTSFAEYGLEGLAIQPA